MKKIFAIILALSLLLASLALFTACGDNGSGDGGEEDNAPCTEHIDTDGDLRCDNCAVYVPAPKPPAPEVVNATFVVKDTDGFILPGVTARFKHETYSDKVGVSDENGCFDLAITEGTYTIYYDYDISVLGYYLSETRTITINKNTTSYELLLVNNNPDGTAAHPLSLNVGDNAVTVPANTTYYFIVYHSIQLSFAIKDGEGLTATYEGTLYAAGNNNEIYFPLSGSDSTSTEIIVVENTTATDKEFNIEIGSLPGSRENPIVITSLGAEISTGAIDSRSTIVYYTYTAAADGQLVIILKSENSTISAVHNGTTGTNSDVDGIISIEVAAGDVVSIECQVRVDGGEVVFIPAINIPTEY